MSTKQIKINGNFVATNHIYLWSIVYNIPKSEVCPHTTSEQNKFFATYTKDDIVLLFQFDLETTGYEWTLFMLTKAILTPNVIHGIIFLFLPLAQTKHLFALRYHHAGWPAKPFRYSVSIYFQWVRIELS